MSILPNTRIIQITTNSNPFRFVSDDGDLGQVHRVHLKNLIVPNTEYNVNSKTAAISITAADMIAVDAIPLGQYNIVEYMAALKVVLDVAANPNTFTITQSGLTRKLTFVKSGGAEFSVTVDSDSRRLIGQATAKSSTGLSLTTDAIPDLSGLRLVGIGSYTLGKFKISEGDTVSESQKNVVLGSLPMDAPFGSILKVEVDEDTLNAAYFAGYKNVSNFDIRLLDEADELIELNGAEWIISMEIHVRGSR